MASKVVAAAASSSSSAARKMRSTNAKEDNKLMENSELDEIPSDDLYFIHLQSSELSVASQTSSDLDFAFQLQLQEALVASSAPNLLHDRSLPPPVIPSSPSNDRSLIFSLQNLELRRYQQETLDHQKAVHQTEQLKREILQQDFDAKFAQSIFEAEWQDYADDVGEPSEEEPIGLDEHERPYKLFFTTIRSDSAQQEDSTSCAPIVCAMAAAILDSEDNVLTELQKPLDVGIGKTVADYTALIAALASVHARGYRHVHAHTDSVTLYNQVTGRWRVRTRKILALWSQVMRDLYKLESYEIFLHPKSENGLALRLAKDVIVQLAKKEDHPCTAGNGKLSKITESCTICLEEKVLREMFTVGTCLHRFCLSCMIQHTEVKVQAGQVPVRCPQVNCSCTLTLDECRSFLPQKWFDSLTRCLEEASIPESERLYCPFPNCSAVMSRSGLENMQQASSSSFRRRKSSRCAECKECHRLFCVECRVPWHSKMSCDEYQQLPAESRDAQDAKLFNLAKHQNWQRCKKCRRMIELSEGCYHMTCLCGYEFCYSCGAEWKNKKQTCECILWDERNLLHEPLEESEDDNDYDYEDFDSDYSYYSDDGDFGYGLDEPDSDDDSSYRDSLNLRMDQFYKTKLCRYWERGNCWAGERCNFAHGVSELKM